MVFSDPKFFFDKVEPFIVVFFVDKEIGEDFQGSGGGDSGQLRTTAPPKEDYAFIPLY
jgi:hypothetical protein